MSRAVRAVAGVALLVVTAFVPPPLRPYLFSLGTSLILGVVSEALTGKPHPRFRASESLVEYSGTVEPRRIVYGTMRTAGMNAIPPWTSGENNKYLHQVLLVAGHKVSNIGDVYFGNTLIEGDASPQVIGPITGTVNDGKVQSGDFADVAWIRRYLGEDSQTVDFILNNAFPSKWTAAHRLDTIAYVATQFAVDEEKYPTGKPDQSFLVDGKLCYDPRLDSSPGNDPTNAAYIAFTHNPALCWSDYMTDTRLGVGVIAADIDWDTVVAAANICDEQVQIPPNSSPRTMQARYTCNVLLFAALSDEERRANIAVLVGAMLGHCHYRGGQWRVYAGAATTGSFDLDHDDLAGKLSIRTETPSNEKYNYVRGQFVDAARDYQLLEFTPRESSGVASTGLWASGLWGADLWADGLWAQTEAGTDYESEDGERLPREVIFPACTNQYEAQRNAIIILKRSRRKRRVTGEWGMSAFGLRVWDVGTMTLDAIGWDDQLVRCLEWTFRPDGVIEATFQEESSSDWDDPQLSDYATEVSGSQSATNYFVPDPPTDFSAFGVQDGIQFSWTPVLTNAFGTVYKIWQYSSPTPFSSATLVVSVYPGNHVFVSRTDAATSYFWITAKSPYSTVESEERPLGAGISAAALAVTVGFRANANPQSLNKPVYNSTSATSGSTTVTPINGSSPHTYSWARISGDTTITANSATSATTTFNVTGLTDGETNSAVFRCTVTDNVAATTTADVSVSFHRDDSFGA